MPETWERWNTHFSTCVEVDCFGTIFRLQQDPNSHNLGSTVWDSSVVFAKYLEKNAKRGELSRQRLKGKRAIELGAGMGLCGLAMAAMGADVLLTDLASVLPLLRQNVEVNFAPSALQGLPWASEAGKVRVQELDWNQQSHYTEAGGKFDFIVCADCVYNEEHMPAFCKTVLALATPKTTVVVINELRSESVHARFMDVMGQAFSFKKVLHSKMDAHFQHPAIDIYLLRMLKPDKGAVIAEPATKCQRCFPHYHGREVPNLADLLDQRTGIRIASSEGEMKDADTVGGDLSC